MTGQVPNTNLWGLLVQELQGMVLHLMQGVARQYSMIKHYVVSCY